MKKGILIAFGELFLKSDQVKKVFTRKLFNNIRFFCQKEKINFKIYKLRDRIYLETDNIIKAEKIIKNIFGIAWYSPVFCFSSFNLKEVATFVSQNHNIKENKTFALRINRKKKDIESKELIIQKIAEKIDRPVNLKKPNKEIFVEIQKNNTFIFFKKKKGKGGLPLGTAGKVLVLMSGGIDSPVASYLISQKGAEPVWLHFHSFPLVSQKSIEKTKELAQVFLKYYPKIKIYFIPFAKAQTEIKSQVIANYRILLYRRLMFKIAEKIAEKENCLALVTGESLGQVSSQTLDNLKIIEKVVSIPVLRPLIEKDKQEIIEIAKKIETLDISNKPQEDCCSLFVPKGATAKGDLEKVKLLEKKINMSKIEKQLLKEIKSCYFSSK